MSEMFPPQSCGGVISCLLALLGINGFDHLSWHYAASMCLSFYSIHSLLCFTILVFQRNFPKHHATASQWPLWIQMPLRHAYIRLLLRLRPTTIRNNVFGFQFDIFGRQSAREHNHKQWSYFTKPVGNFLLKDLQIILLTWINLNRSMDK